MNCISYTGTYNKMYVIKMNERALTHQTSCVCEALHCSTERASLQHWEYLYCPTAVAPRTQKPIGCKDRRTGEPLWEQARQRCTEKSINASGALCYIDEVVCMCVNWRACQQRGVECRAGESLVRLQRKPEINPYFKHIYIQLSLLKQH